MHRLRPGFWFALAAMLAAGATVARATPPRSPISVNLDLPGLSEGELSGKALVEVVSTLPAPGTTVTLIVPEGMEVDQSEWTVDLAAGVPVALTTTWWLYAEPGNYTVSALATRTLGPGSSWGDMQSIPYHVGSDGHASGRWAVNRVPVAKLVRPGTAVIISDEPTPFAFENRSAVHGIDEAWPSVEALPPLDPEEASRAPDAKSDAPPSPLGTVTLTGTWQYPDRSGVPRAVDQQYIEIRHGDGTPLSPRVFCFTQTDGSFSCSFTHPGTTMRVWLRSATNLTPGPTRLGVFSGIEVPGGCGSDSIDCTYANSSPTISCSDGGTCSLGVMVAAGGEPWIGAHQMTQDLVRSWKKILFDPRHLPGTHGGPAKITYPTPTGHGPHAHVFDEGSETTGDPWLSIPAPFQTAADVIIHEYGHAVMDNLWYADSPDWPQKDCPSAHFLGYPSGSGCGLSEGFADFWSWYGNEFYDGDADPANDGPIYNDPGFSANFETRDDGTWYPGPKVEGNVAGSFGDMMDAANEGPPPCGGAGDRLADGIENVWEVMYSGSYLDFQAWWTAYWSVYQNPYDAAYETIHHNAIDFGFPGNDVCHAADEISGYIFADRTDTSTATCTDADDPVPDCGNGSNARGVYYHWTAPGAGTVTVDTFGSDYDTILSAWSGECGNLASVACNDDSGGAQSKLLLGVSAGQSLTFLVSAYYGDGGDLHFNFSFKPYAATNDECSSPKVIGTTPFSDLVDVSAATGDAGDPDPSCVTSETTRSVFYRWTAPADGTMHADTFGSSYDTVLSVYTGACGGLVEQACNDDEGVGLGSAVSLPVTIGTTYTLMVTSLGAPTAAYLAFHLDLTAPPPPHDECAAARVVSTFPYSDLTTSYAASSAPGDPPPSCGNQSTGKNVWYRFTSPASGVITVDTFGSAYDTILSAYTGSCGTLSEIPGGCNDDFQPPDRSSRLQFEAVAGTTYYFQVSAYSGDGGPLSFHLDLAPYPPLNDPCGGAFIVTGSPWADATYTSAATSEPGEPASPCGNGSSAKSVWYRFTAPGSGLLSANTFGSSYDTILSVWSGGCAALTAEACNDDAPSSTASALSMAVEKGVTYHLRVSAYAGDGGQLGFGVEFLADSGHVPDGDAYPGEPLRVTRVANRQIELTWSSSCLETDTDYAVYEGALGNYYSHVPLTCDTGGAQTIVFTPAPFNAYYLVAPRNAALEGSHGLRSPGVEREVAGLTCYEQSLAECAPACAHDPCAAGSALDPACSDCVAEICAGDPSCCASGWTSGCATIAERSCPQECFAGAAPGALP